MSNALTKVERWGAFELTLQGPTAGNPFLDVQLCARFHCGHRIVEVDGFYDGEGRYKIRFMPDTLGQWRYVTQSNVTDLSDVIGQFTCTAPEPGNHGPVGVRNTYHFAYADGTPYFQVGTTCYAWAHQGEDLENTTLDTLGRSPFNKIRMCVFPKHYAYSKNEPEYHPFEQRAAGQWNFERFNARFFKHFEQRVGQLLDLGIQADVILFHPYDRWGYATMDAKTDDRYLRYLVARLSAYRNVWWSLANEYDLMEAKSLADWDRFFRIVQESDPYQRLRSIHNCRQFYDHSRPWVTHCSVQNSDLSRTREWRDTYRKPVVVDECCYEGNIEQNWGNISAQELVHRFWLGAVGGGYAGHGETYLHPEDVLWWSKGGILHGASPPRIAFLREILEQGPPQGLDPLLDTWRGKAAGREGEYYLFYFGVHQPAEYRFHMPKGVAFEVDIIDTWEMTSTRLDGTFEGAFQVSLPGKPHFAVRINKSKRNSAFDQANRPRL